MVDIIKMDFKDPHGTSLQNIVNIGKNFNKQVAAYNVNTQEAYDKAVELGCDYIRKLSRYTHCLSWPKPRITKACWIDFARLRNAK